MPTKIFVGNLSDHASDVELRSLFELYGVVKECDILNNFGFVHMDDENEANKAIESLHGHSFAGTKINVELSSSKGSKGRGGGRGGRGGRGGARNGYGPMKGGRGGGRPAPYGRDRGYDRERDYYRRGYDDDPYARDPYYGRRSPPPMDMYARGRDPYYDRYYERDPYPPSRASYYDRPSDPYASRPPADYYSRPRGYDDAPDREYEYPPRAAAPAAPAAASSYSASFTNDNPPKSSYSGATAAGATGYSSFGASRGAY